MGRERRLGVGGCGWEVYQRYFNSIRSDTGNSPFQFSNLFLLVNEYYSIGK